VSVIIAGNPSSASALAETLARGGTEARAWSPEPPEDAGDPGSSAPLARALVSFDAQVQATKPEAVVLADDSDAALAAALVATKLLITVEAVPGASEAASANGRLIAQLAGTYTLAA
jgi:hypothetical protein